MGAVYTGIPDMELQPGKRFSPEFNPVEKEFSRKVGDIRFASPISMRNEFSRIRLQHKAGGNMFNKKLMCAIPFTNATGKEVTVNL